MNLVMQLLSWSQVWTGCVATGNGEPSGTTVAEDLESLDKDALILKLKQVGVTLYEPCKVIWSDLIALQQLGCNTHLDINSVAMVSKADGSDTAKSVCTMVHAGSTKVHGTCAAGQRGHSYSNVCGANVHLSNVCLCVCCKYACKALYGSAGIEGESALEGGGG